MKKTEALVEAADFGIPFCPYCLTTMVKTRVQNEEGDWARHWLCECKVGPPEDMFVPEDHPQVAEEKHSPERREESYRAALCKIATSPLAHTDAFAQMARSVAREVLDEWSAAYLWGTLGGTLPERGR